MHFKSLCLLSFSLAFLTKGIAYDRFQVVENDNDHYPSEERYQSQKDSNSESNSSQECLSPFHSVHIGVRHNEARGIGYNDGYTTLEVFGIYDAYRYGSYFMPFFDLRGHVFNNGKLAGNAGIGERTLIPSINHTFGSYLYYDVRRVGKGLTVNQLSPGLELVGKRMEYRINGYFPVGKDKSHKYRYEFDKFDDNSIILKSKQYHAMRGGDAEIGVHLTQSTKYDLYAAAGPYYLHSSHASSWGGRARLLGRFMDYVSLEAAYSYDQLFRSVIEGNVAVTLPLGRKLKRTTEGCPQGNDLLLSRAAFSPSRFEIPVVKSLHVRDKAINPVTGKPWVVWFVNNTSHSNGTYESPFPTLLQAQNASSPNDMIYVFPGDGTTNGMNAGIALQNGQAFFGSGIEQPFATKNGIVRIPAMSAIYPSITSSLAVPISTVFLGSGNVVSGFNITSPGYGISSGTNVANSATIANNRITLLTPGAVGVNIGGIGTFNIYNNSINTNISVVGSLAWGLILRGKGTFNISNNQISGPVTTTTSSIFATAIYLQNTTGAMKGVISNNSTSGFAQGIQLSDSNPQGFNFLIRGNTVTGFGNKGIQVPMLGMVSVIENIVQGSPNNVTAGFPATSVSQIGISVINSIPSTSGSSVIVENNQVVMSPTVLPSRSASLNGIVVNANSANPGSLLTAIIDNNKVLLNPTVVIPNTFGISVTATNSTSMFLIADIENNSVNTVAASGNAFNFNSTNSSTICLTLDDNTAANPPTFAGFGFTTAGTSRINIDSLEGNVGGPVTFTSTAGNGVFFVPPGTCGK